MSKGYMFRFCEIPFAYIPFRLGLVAHIYIYIYIYHVWYSVNTRWWVKYPPNASTNQCWLVIKNWLGYQSGSGFGYWIHYLPILFTSNTRPKPIRPVIKIFTPCQNTLLVGYRYKKINTLLIPWWDSLDLHRSVIKFHPNLFILYIFSSNYIHPFKVSLFTFALTLKS
jgi:hypothetical protein